MPVEAVIFDLDGTLAHFNLDFKALRGEVRGYLIRAGVPTSVLNVNESIFEMLTKSRDILQKRRQIKFAAKVFEEVRSQSFSYR